MSVQGLVICRGPVNAGKLPPWAKMTVKNWCKGCPCVEVHCDHECREHTGQKLDANCGYCQPIDQEVADEVAALPESIWPEWGDVAPLTKDYWDAQREENKFYNMYLGEVLHGKKERWTEGGRGPSDPCTKTAKDCDLTRNGVAQR